MVKDGDGAARGRVPPEQAVEQDPGFAALARLLGRGDLFEPLLPGGRPRPTPAVPDPVEAEVGRDAVEEARGVAGVETLAPLEEAHENVLARVHGFVLVAQEVKAAPEDHRPVSLAEALHIQRCVAHATPSTPEGAVRVTAPDSPRTNYVA